MTPTAREEWIARLAEIADDSARTAALAGEPGFRDCSAVAAIHDEVVRLALVDLERAERLAAAARALADSLGDEWARAVSRRAAGHVHYGRAEYSAAAAEYSEALAAFERLGAETEAARTLNSSLQSLIYLGRYDEAFAAARQARDIFSRHGDRLRLARLDSNMGNILYRQDRYSEALALYRQAREAFDQIGEARDVAAVLSNMAVCSISLNEYNSALDYYREARAWCERHGMPLLVAEADYNIAYLHYLRGEYARAIELYRAAREHCGLVGDGYHAALCDLDQSEIYLELNLNREGADLARRAFDSFDRLGMGYEKAKALTNLAMSTSNLGDGTRALRLLRDARTLFVAEKNLIWPALTDLYRGLALYRSGKRAAARAPCRRALDSFVRLGAAGKAALAELLLARLALDAREYDSAREICRSALGRVEAAEMPWLEFHLRFVLGRVEEELGDREAARREYESAAATVERLRSGLAGDELKIAFFEDKAAVYEGLVWLALDHEAPRQDQAFEHIEKAKSRGLTDLIARHAPAVRARRDGSSKAAERVDELRKDLSWHYHRIDAAQRSGRESAAQAACLLQQARACEDELSSALKDLRATDLESAALHEGGSFDLETIQSAIPPGAVMIEYFQARDTIFACVLDGKRLSITAVGAASRVRSLFLLLQLQLGKFRLGPEYVAAFAAPLRQAVDSHLTDLYQELIAPIRHQLDGEHLIVAPHGFLHYLPFHALHSGSGYLADDFSVSYTPSASIYYLCAAKKRTFEDRALVLGVGDALAPHILEEARAAASALPNARVFLNEDATEERLREDGPGSRFVHIATHGMFRRDNPMFSSIRLGGGRLTLLDLYDLDLSSELVTLSGCSTGMSAVLGGDELVGLVRGLLYAGAHGVLVTLWDVHDHTTADFMRSFYGHLQAGRGKAEALRKAMRDLRNDDLHPYYWAPFALVGNHL